MANQYLTITPEELAKSAVQYRRELLIMPTKGAAATLDHMRGLPGVNGRVVIGQLAGDIELGPYDATREDTDGVQIVGRTLQTYLGSVIKKFDVNEAAGSVYSELYAQGIELTTADLARQVLMYLSLQLGKKLNMAIWSGVRNDAGTKTAELFDGFDTITSAEITAGTISEDNGNLINVDALTEENAVDVIKSIYEAAAEELQDVPTKMYMSRNAFNLYNRAYKAETGAIVYNQNYTQTFLEGSNGLCELVPLGSKKDSKFIHLSTKSNMVYGFGAGLADENIAVEKYHPFLLDYVATMYFGVQFETVSPERLMVAQFASN